MSADTRTQLLNEAEIQLRKNGYNAISFRDLAASLGIKSASVHYHFPKKADLGVALVERYAKRFFDGLDAETSAESSAHDKVSVFRTAYRNALTGADAMCLCGMLGAESHSLPEPVSKAARVFFDDNIAWLEAALPAEWTKSQRHSRAVQIVSTLQGAMLVSTVSGNVEPFDHTAQHVLQDIFG